MQIMRSCAGERGCFFSLVTKPKRGRQWECKVAGGEGAGIVEIDKSLDVLCIPSLEKAGHSCLMKKALFLPFLLAFVQPGFAGIIWTQDFQSQTPGSAPSGTGISTIIPAGAQVTVLDDETTVTDPFGPTGNHSLMLEKTENGPHPKAIFTFGQSYSAGVLTLDAYSFSNPSLDAPLISITLYNGDAGSSSNIGAWLWLGGTGLTVQDGATARTAANVWDLNQAGEIKVEFFTNSTFSVSIDDEMITIGGKTAFSYFRSSVTGADRVQISIGETARTKSRVFVDDLSLSVAIPEPGAVVLMGLAGGALFMFSRKISRKG